MLLFFLLNYEVRKFHEEKTTSFHCSKLPFVIWNRKVFQRFSDNSMKLSASIITIGSHHACLHGIFLQFRNASSPISYSGFFFQILLFISLLISYNLGWRSPLFLFLLQVSLHISLYLAILKCIRCVLKGTALPLFNKTKKKSNQSYPRNRPWRPIGFWYVKDSTLSRQSAHS
jgi:hypothetical protein